jgi:hypothetical protein
MSLVAFLGLGAAGVKAQTISLPILPAVGAGLQVGPISATLSVSQHGGVTVRIESSDPSVALVSRGFSMPGTSIIDVPVPNGSATVSFFVQGMEGAAPGTATITASAPGFTGASRSVTVVTPAYDIIGLVQSISTLDPTDPFAVRVGVGVGSPPTSVVPQAVRMGSPGVVATIAVSDATVGELVTSSTTGPTVVVFIAAGFSQSPPTVSSGGVAFDGFSVGTTEVLASIPGFVAATGATRLVSVTSPVPVENTTWGRVKALYR